MHGFHAVEGICVPFGRLKIRVERTSLFVKNPWEWALEFQCWNSLQYPTPVYIWCETLKLVYIVWCVSVVSSLTQSVGCWCPEAVKTEFVFTLLISGKTKCVLWKLCCHSCWYIEFVVFLQSGEFLHLLPFLWFIEGLMGCFLLLPQWSLLCGQL